MIDLRRFDGLGSANRARNADAIAAGTGFSPHGHADMEIVTSARGGAITRGGDFGNTGRTVAGDVQVMRAGTAIRHPERDGEPGTRRIFRIWILPRGRGEQGNAAECRSAPIPGRR